VINTEKVKHATPKTGELKSEYIFDFHCGDEASVEVRRYQLEHRVPGGRIIESVVETNELNPKVLNYRIEYRIAGDLIYRSREVVYDSDQNLTCVSSKGYAQDQMLALKVVGLPNAEAVNSMLGSRSVLFERVDGKMEAVSLENEVIGTLTPSAQAALERHYGLKTK
jgi:hypothetical protein